MTAKITAARAAAFLKSLAASGNITLAAERAKVSRAWVLKRRREDAGFDAAVRRALAQAREALCGRSREEVREIPDQVRDDGKSNQPAKQWRSQEGVELVVRGTRSGTGRRVQIGRARVRQWTGRTEERFLAALGRTCNVKAACREVGMCHSSAYGHRNRWPAFAKAWDSVIDEAMLRLEMAQIECACCALEGIEVPVDNPIREMTASEAIYLLEMFKRRREGHPRRWGRQAWTKPSIEEVRALVMRKVDVIIRARGRS